MTNREETKNSLVALLNGNETDAECGEKIFNGIDLLYNSFGSAVNTSDGIMAELNRNGTKRFWIAWAICGMELAWHYIYKNFNEWDDRKKKSEIYAYNNISLITNIFEKNIGLKISFDGVTSKIKEENMCFYKWFVEQIYKNFGDWEYIRNNRWLERLATKFSCMHSTIKQSYFGGVVRAKIDESERFPFI